LIVAADADAEDVGTEGGNLNGGSGDGGGEAVGERVGFFYVGEGKGLIGLLGGG
jgi:hypothetical protein